MAEDVDEDYVKLSWNKPKSDGGSPIEGYIVEVKEKGSDKWKPINPRTPCKDTTFKGKEIFLQCAYSVRCFLTTQGLT